jgi:hypothetical protein
MEGHEGKPQEEVSQETLNYYLAELNRHWKRYDELERGHTNLTMGEYRKAAREAEISYAFYELQLAKAGWKWDELDYDKGTKVYSFPELKPE